ncbi:guanylate cyclase activator 2B-like [Lithobates pipiens]
MVGKHSRCHLIKTVANEKRTSFFLLRHIAYKADTRILETPAEDLKMWTELLFLLVFLYGDCVIVEVGDHTFPLESVKKYKDILYKSPNVKSDDYKTHGMSVCKNPGLPKEFQELCQTGDHQLVMKTLTEIHKICASMDECELCAHPACRCT